MITRLAVCVFIFVVSTNECLNIFDSPILKNPTLAKSTQLLQICQYFHKAIECSNATDLRSRKIIKNNVLPRLSDRSFTNLVTRPNLLLPISDLKLKHKFNNIRTNTTKLIYRPMYNFSQIFNKPPIYLRNTPELSRSKTIFTDEKDKYDVLLKYDSIAPKYDSSDKTENTPTTQINSYSMLQEDDHIERRMEAFDKTSLEEQNTDQNKALLNSFIYILDDLDRRFYTTTFNRLKQISPPDRSENAISFVQSGLFLTLYLLTLSTETDIESSAEINNYIGFNFTHEDKINLLNQILSDLPKSNVDLKWCWTSRLVLGTAHNVSKEFQDGTAKAFKLKIDQFNGTETSEELSQKLDNMVEEDSGGVIQHTFDPDEFVEGVRAVALTTLYLRARWRSGPTLLNGTRAFRDAPGTPSRTCRMIRINDIMRYASFNGFQAIEIFYATPGLTMLVLVPDGRSLRSVADQIETMNIHYITSRMAPMRVAVTMPLYTLRMTLLLPSKLQAMGINKLVDWTNSNECGKVRLSHAVQRIMFWAEAGRNAFKDDGIEWDAPPEQEIMVDRPYLFFVRWQNITLMNGNFAL